MKIALFITTNIPFQIWSPEYYSELIIKLKENYDIYIFSKADESINFKLQSDQIKTFQFDNPNEIVEKLRECEVYIGFDENDVYDLAKSLKLKTVIFSTYKQVPGGVQTLSPCKYCFDNVDVYECFYRDYLCSFALTPLMVINKLREVLYA